MLKPDRTRPCEEESLFVNEFKRTTWLIVVAVVAIAMTSVGTMASPTGAIGGTVVDSLGARVSGTVMLYRNGALVGQTSSAADGRYLFSGLESGRYQVAAEATGFETRLSEPVFVGGSGTALVNISVGIGRLDQQISVTAAATPMPVAQIGAPVSVITRDLIDQLAKPDVLEALRTVPGLSIVQTGARGGTTAVFVRGGESDWNKVFVDGAAANDIGGSFSFDALSTAAIERVEVMRTANSVLYGPDAMSGVVAVDTRRGRSRIPTVTYALDGGNFHTVRSELSIGGTFGRFDYFVDGSIYDTDNDLPNNEYRNDAFVSRVGFLLGTRTDVTATLRRTETDFGFPDGVLYYGVPDDERSKTRLTFATVRSVSTAEPITVTLQYAFSKLGRVDTDPEPTGEAYDPFGLGPNYLGDVITVSGENGSSTTGRAILDFGGAYPSIFRTSARRHLLSGQTDIDITGNFALTLGGRLEDEEGRNTFSSLESRLNHGYFIESRGNLGQRFFVTAGLGIEDHAVFDVEVVPRLSVAFYARPPVFAGPVGESKLMFNVGKGIKAPNVFEAQSSLFRLLEGVDGGPALIERFQVGRIRPERTRNWDVGFEQVLWDGNMRIGVSYFNNRNEDLIEFVSSNILPQLSVPSEVASASGFGAYLNAASFDAQGLELSGEAAIRNNLRLSGFYTFLDAAVTESFADSALTPVFNPKYPETQIGQFSPLVGARPFRRPTHSGGLTVSYTHDRALVSVTSSFIGRQDDSTFLSDSDFGHTMVLPNTGLSGNYQKVDMALSYRIDPRVKWYTSVENVLNQEYTSASGFPGLPVNLRTGVRVTLGGDDF